jgi:hypothetical protein
MMRRIGFTVLLAGLVVSSSLSSFAAEAKKESAPKPKTEAKKSEAPKPQTQLVTEGEFARWLVQVLGLSRFVPAAPSDQECFAILLQNSIKPKDGWNATNVVTRGILARVTVQSMGKTSEVKDPAKDESYIEFLKGVGIEIGTIGEAVETLDALGDPLANEAIVAKTDPLSKVHRIRPVGEQQLGADMATIQDAVTAEEIATVFTPSPTPRKPRPLTPN